MKLSADVEVSVATIAKKGERMKLVIVALFVLMIVAVISQAASSMSTVDFNIRPQSSDSDAKKIETKMAESLRNVESARQAGTSAGSISDPIGNGSAANISAFNSSVNTTASALNSSMLNSSAQNKIASSGSTMDSPNDAPQEMGTSSKGASNGFWGISANKHVMGQSDIKSRMVLSGNFEVDKTVQFTDKGD